MFDPVRYFRHRVREDDLIEKAIGFDGAFALVPHGPGLGIVLDRKALEKYKVGPVIEKGLSFVILAEMSWPEIKAVADKSVACFRWRHRAARPRIWRSRPIRRW